MTARGMDGATILGDNEYDQAKVVFDKIKNLVEAAGGVMDDVVKMTIFVTDIANNADVWKARQEFFTGDFPACTLVQVAALAKPEILRRDRSHGRRRLQRRLIRTPTHARCAGGSSRNRRPARSIRMTSTPR